MSAGDRRLVLSGIVAGESRAKVVGEAVVVTAVIDRALEEVHVVHRPRTCRWSCPGKCAEYPNFGEQISSVAGAQNRVLGCGRRLKPSFAEPTEGSLRKVLHLCPADASQALDSACQP